MTKHGTTSQATGNYVEFQAAVLRALPRDINPEVALWWTNHGELLALNLSEAFTSAKPTAGNTLFITCEGGIKTSELVRLGEYDWVNSDITDARFPTQAHAPVSRMIELVEFDHDPGSREVFAEFSRRGLERPTYEEALTFGVQHPEEQRKHPVVFLHEPVQVSGDRSVLVLGEDGRERRLGLDWFVRRWSRHCVFAAVRSSRGEADK